jgi:hypothetical protein
MYLDTFPVALSAAKLRQLATTVKITELRYTGYDAAIQVLHYQPSRRALNGRS